MDLADNDVVGPLTSSDERFDDDLIELQFVVPPDRHGWRLDRFLHDRIPRLSRTRLQRLIDEEVMGPNAERLKSSHRVRFGDVILMYRPAPEEPPVPNSFDILFEDDDIFAIDKPAGLPVHPTARFHRHTLTWLLRRRYGEKRPIIVHRLDRETSGVLICAKNKAAERALKGQFEARTVRKAYLAVVAGDPSFRERRIDIPLGPAEDSDVRIRVGPRYDDLGVSAQTDLKVLERLGSCALVEARPLTGRQHQIRAHLAAIDHPIVGDKIYGVDERLFIDFVERSGDLSVGDWRRLEISRHALHAHRIELTHPESGAAIALTCPLALDLTDYLKVRRQLREEREGSSW